MSKILLIEDEITIAEQIIDLLKFSRHLVDLAGTCAEAVHLLTLSAYDLLIFDRNVPDGDALAVLASYRKAGGMAPALIITGRHQVSDKLDGFSHGADDYLTKPFHLMEFNARVLALLRRQGTIQADKISVSGIEIDRLTRRVFQNGQEVSIAKTDLQLLEFLMSNPDQMFTTESLLNRVWSASSEATAAAVKSAVRRLRTKLDPDGTVILSSYGNGYMFASEPQKSNA